MDTRTRRRWSWIVGLTAAATTGTASAQNLVPTLALAGSQDQAALTPTAFDAPSISELGRLSIEQLASLPVTSVAKRAEPLSQAPAAIYVITRDEIERSGATSLPEMLRLAPNLQVYRTSASNYVITARGFSGNHADQSFTNQLLVLIDGRSVYTPLYSGVYWDMQDVLPADVDRIEVISGPGAALWGANAVNGVINIITRKAADTQGVRLDVGSGSLETAWDAQFGGKVGNTLAYRAYFKTFWMRDTVTAAGHGAGDHWTRPQGGFRLDWAPSSTDTVTLQGDAYQGAEATPGSVDQRIAGRNVSGRWNHELQAGLGSLEVQAYYDHTERGGVTNSGYFWLDTYDVDAQHSFELGPRNSIVWGGGGRFSRYRIDNTQSLLFIPQSRELNLGDLFAQDTVALTKQLHVTLGVKLENDPYSGLAVLPNLRASYTPTDQVMLWAAASRAVRSPTPFDTDVVEKVRGVAFLTGNREFDPVDLTAYEAGMRTQIGSRASISASVYYNVYDNIRSIEITPATFTPLHWGNGIKGDTYGLEAWADYRPAEWWRLGAGLNLMGEKFRFKPGASGLLGTSQVGDDPTSTFKLKSSFILPHGISVDLFGRYYSALPNPKVPAYGELDARIGWMATDHLLLSVSGRNLLHPQHQEFPAPDANAVPRSVFINLSWGF